MDILYLLIQNAYISMTVLLVVALGGLLAERSGVTNIALEGIMILGAFLGVWAIHGLEIYPYSLMTIVVMIVVVLIWVISLDVLVNFGLSKLGFKRVGLNRLHMKQRENRLYIALNIFIVLVFASLIMLSFFLFGIPKQIILIMGIMIGGAVGGVYAMIHAHASIYMKADQVISATALNLFAPAFAIFTARFIQRGQQIPFSSSFMIPKIPFLGDIPIIGELFFTRVFISFYIALALLVIIWIIVYKSKFGLRLRACGENPHAADSLGINIYKLRFKAVTLSGVFAGMGGVIFVISTSTEFNVTVAGFGFLAIAVLIFGNWRPSGILMAAIFFGFTKTLAASYTAIPFLDNLGLQREYYELIPFIATLIILAFFSKNSQAPKALGQIYDQGKR
jgi:simple sugar transport system permease protein